jgi:MOSC domain-containing protein YiiM
MSSKVEEIYIAPAGGVPMQKVEEVEAEANAGLCGDRYKKRTGYWSGTDECQVTLIEGENLDWIGANTDIQIGNGEHRRNIITRDIRLEELQGKRFAIGTAVLEYDRPRPPCGYIQGLTQQGMTRALGGTRGGICARVVQSGTIRVQDTIQVL